MELSEILVRIEGRLSAVGLSASKASRQAGKPDAIRNMQRAVREHRRGSVTVDTISALAPVLRTTTEWLLTGQGKREADEVLELLPVGKLNPLTDAKSLHRWLRRFRRWCAAWLSPTRASLRDPL
jgi:hypothetical protein